MDALLRNKVDLLMQPYQFTQPNFFHAYKNGRMVINYSGKGKAVAKNVSEAEFKELKN